ncbi:hypothetical protein PHMEG_00031717 [Phytophthora megakarya]|uniref:Uncharacterized protein n=1 Tax=Phytophthora megakarya TaxID=4795 RepID=A0A225UXF2_9STRA|nr:hypothetical protein PHMEG_00031717 [Phytophthora megakarya]
MSTLLKRMLDRHRVSQVASQVACTLGTSKPTLELGNCPTPAPTMLAARVETSRSSKGLSTNKWLKFWSRLRLGSPKVNVIFSGPQKSTVVKNNCFEMEMPSYSARLKITA